MAILPFGEWLPDGPPFGNPGTVVATNVVPRSARGYGPFLSPVPYAPALPATVCGSYGYRAPDGTVYNFAGTPTDLFLQKTGSTTFANVSRTSGGPYITVAPPDGYWQMTSFGKRVIATNFVDPVQSYVVGTDTNFSMLASAAPRGRFVAVIKDFVMLGNVVDAIDGTVPYRLAWCAIGNPTNWPPYGSNAAIEVQADFQDLVQTDLGEITQVVGGLLSAADGAAFCERGIYRIQYAGSPDIFDFQVAEGASGTDSPLSVVLRRLLDSGGVAHAVAYYLGVDGFCAFDGSSSASIGGQKVDRFFFNDLDVNFIRNVTGTYDPLRKLVIWLYHGQGNSGLYNRALIFNWELSRWTFVDLTPIPVEWVEPTTYTTGGFNLDQMDPLGPLDSLAYSLDSRVWTSGNPTIGWFDSNHAQNFLTGPSLAAIIETSEAQLFPDKRARINGVRPLHDSVVAASVSVGARDILRKGVVYQPAVIENILGDCPQRTTGRYTRFQVRLPAGANFNFAQGVDVRARPEGIR